MDEHRGQFEKISDSVQITSLLKRAKEARLLLNVTLANDGNLYNSALLEVLPADNALLLDELHPGAGHTRVGVDTILHVFGRLQGVEMSFTTPVLRIGSQDGVAYYRAAIPTHIYYQQRRGHYRVRVGAGRSIPVLLPLDPQVELEGELFDISAGGIGIRLRQPPGDRLAAGQRVDNCRIGLHDSDPLVCDLEIRTVRSEGSSGQCVVGACFSAMERREQQRIQRFVASLDRDMRKKAKRAIRET